MTAAEAPGQSAGEDANASLQYSGYEVVLGVTSRAQALIVFDGRGDDKIAIMTGNFVPSPQIFLASPFRPFREKDARGRKIGRTGYYWKISYNSFSLDRQEDPDTGGIGAASPVYNYGTNVEGHFLAVAPVVAYEVLKPDGMVTLRLECGLGLGYLDLEGDIVLGDWQGDPLAPKTEIDYRGPSFFVYVMGRHYWNSFMFGYQMGINATSSTPYSFSQSYVSLDIGYRIMF
jgi:hypothetical protein